MPASDLYAFASGLLGVAEAALAADSIPVPGNAFVATGDPPFDCAPLLSTTVMSVDTALLSPVSVGGNLHRLQGGHRNLVQLRTWIVLCAPTISGAPGGVYTLPTPAQEDALSTDAYAAGWSVWNGFKSAYVAGLLPPCDEFVLGPMVPVTPQGGMAGFVIATAFGLDGYTVAL